MKLLLPCCVLVVAAAAAAFIFRPQSSQPTVPWKVAAEGLLTVLPAAQEQRRELIIEAATDISYMRPFIERFQQRHPDLTVRYMDFISGDLLVRARRICGGREAAPDLYVSVSTDHLVELANYGCARAVPATVANKVPPSLRWRGEVIAFAAEPAVMVYNTAHLSEAEVPRSHQALIEMLRDENRDWRGKIGTYDIEVSGSGYNYAAFDARQSAIYGRLIESFGRIAIKTYCCSNRMVEAVHAGEIVLAYNVQMSYAHAAQREGAPVGVVFPDDYQAVQTRSAMVSRYVRNLSDAVAFVDYLVSAEAQQLARQIFAAPADTAHSSGGYSQRLLSQVTVGPSLLALRDQARRERLIREWKAAIRVGAGAAD